MCVFAALYNTLVRPHLEYAMQLIRNEIKKYFTKSNWMEGFYYTLQVIFVLRIFEDRPSVESSLGFNLIEIIFDSDVDI